MRGELGHTGYRSPWLATCLAAVSLLSLVSPAWAVLGLFGDKPSQVQIAIIADDSLNKRADGQSTSVFIRIYKLGSDSAFLQQDFFTLYKTGADAELFTEMDVLPAMEKLLPMTEMPRTVTQIGVMAAFRDWETSSWQAVMDIAPGKKIYLVIRLQDSSVTIERVKKRAWKKIKKSARQ